MGSSSLLAAFSSGLSTSLNALCTTILLFKMKAEGNLNHLLVATKRAGSGAVNSICSPVSPFSTAPTDETPYFSGDADTWEQRITLAQVVYLLK